MVQISNDVFIDMLWRRVSEFYAANSYPKSFWKAIFEYLSECGFLDDPSKNNPLYIVDNIAVNGCFKTVEDLESEGMEINPDWLKFGDYYCIDGQMGL